MKMAERPQDVDYQPDVLKFKQIWQQMNVPNQQKPTRQGTQPVNNKDKSKIQQKTKDHSTKKQPSKNASKQKKQPSQAPQKQTVYSSNPSGSTRNPKQNPSLTVQFSTSPQAPYQSHLHNQLQSVDHKTLLQTAITPSSLPQLTALKKQLHEKDYQLSLLRVSNSTLEGRIRALEQQIQGKDRRIAQLEARERELMETNCGLVGVEKVFDYGKVEYENFKNDTRRLLKMLQSTNEYQQFANLGLEDGGVRFLNQVNKKNKSSLDSKNKSTLHFCTCNKEFIPESGFWVPEKVYNFGKQFLKQRKGELTQPQLQLMLYDLNKIYREREKRIINTLSGQKAKQVDFLKRKINLHKSTSLKD